MQDTLVTMYVHTGSIPVYLRNQPHAYTHTHTDTHIYTHAHIHMLTNTDKFDKSNPIYNLYTLKYIITFFVFHFCYVYILSYTYMSHILYIYIY